MIQKFSNLYLFILFITEVHICIDGKERSQMLQAQAVVVELQLNVVNKVMTMMVLPAVHNRKKLSKVIFLSFSLFSPNQHYFIICFSPKTIIMIKHQINNQKLAPYETRVSDIRHVAHTILALLKQILAIFYIFP